MLRINPVKSGGGDEMLGGLGQNLPQRRRHDGAAPVGHHGHAQPAQFVAERAEPGLPALHARQAELVARVVAVAHVEPTGRVAHAAGHAADGDRVVAVGVAVTGNHAEGHGGEDVL